MSGAEEQEDEGLSSLCEGPSTLCEDLSSLYDDPSSLCEDQSSLYDPSNLGEGPSILCEGPSTLGVGPSILCEGPSSLCEGPSTLCEGPSTLYEGPSTLCEAPESAEACIDMRIHKLQNRCFLLQQMQQVIRRTEDTQHNNGEDSELELVEREIQDLLRQKKILSNKNSLSSSGSHTGQEGIRRISCNVEMEGAVYTLPPLHFTPDILAQPTGQSLADPDPPEEPSDPLGEKEEDIKQLEPAESLGKEGAFTLCPSCEQVVFTQTKRFNGESFWITSCVMGFVGLCFIAFCLKNLKSVRHKCPQCQTTIHTHHPF